MWTNNIFLSLTQDWKIYNMKAERLSGTPREQKRTNIRWLSAKAERCPHHVIISYHHVRVGGVQQGSLVLNWWIYLTGLYLYSVVTSGNWPYCVTSGNRDSGISQQGDLGSWGVGVEGWRGLVVGWGGGGGAPRRHVHDSIKPSRLRRARPKNPDSFQI